MTRPTAKRAIIGVVVGIANTIEVLGLFAIGGLTLLLAAFYSAVLAAAWFQSLTALQPIQNYILLATLTVAVAALYVAGGWFIFELRNTAVAARLS